MADFVTSAGLQIKALQDIVDELAARQKADINAALNTSADSPIGLLNGIVASQLREAWEVLLVAYNGFNPDAAEGFLLEALSGLTGTSRRSATKSQALAVDVDLDNGKVLLAGTHYASVTGDAENRWTPVANFTSPSDGVHSVDFEAEFAGAVVANAATITDIAVALSGWNSVTNPTDAAVGREIDTDEELRTRRETTLRATGSATVDAIRADVLSHESVLQCNVFENVTDSIDVNGLPAHAFECVVYDGTPTTLTDNEIAQLIWDTKPAGNEAFGTSSGVATDSVSGQHTIGFSRPVVREVYLELDIDVDSVAGYAGAAALKTALVALNDSHNLVGRDVILKASECVAQLMAGIFDVTAIRAGFTASPVGTANLVISTRELARFDTSRILITENSTPIP